MRTSLAWLGVSVLLSIIAPFPALAQSNPFAGSWNGTITEQDTSTCTCTGTACASAPQGFTCNLVIPWAGKVDAQGNVTIATQAATATCTPGTTETVGAQTRAVGQLNSNGLLTIPGFSDASGSCQPETIQFSLSPANVTGHGACNSTNTSSITLPSGGSFTVTCTDADAWSYTGSLSAAAPTPPFQMQVSSSITTTTANATAQVQPPSQLVGTTASIYVFAHARQSALGKSAPKNMSTGLDPAPVRDADGAGPDPCVLAQLNANGQLVGASASSLQAFTTGVINSQTQSVTILNNVSTPSVAGASFYVGFGTTSSAMLSSGLYEGAVSVQGANGCSAALLTGAAPNAPGALSGLWWNPNESGWGVSFSQRRNVVFAAWYTYDASGNPKWYVASDCAMPSGSTGTTGTCNGSLYEVSGPTFFGAPFNPSLVHVATAGTLQVSFQDANTASMSYTVAGQSRTVPIVRQVFQNGTTPPAVDYTDLWWNASESGWGLVATQQYGVMFLAWFVYDANGKPAWYVATDCTVVGSGCSGTLYQTSGPPFGPTFNPAAVHATAVGTIGLAFTDANNAQLTYTVNGVSATKTITRQLF